LGEEKDISQALRLKLESQKEQAFLSRELSQIRIDVPIDMSIEKHSWKDYDQEKATKILEDLEFYTLVPRLPVPGQQKEDPSPGQIKKEKKNEKIEDKLKENLRIW